VYLLATGISKISIENEEINAADITTITNEFIRKVVFGGPDYRPGKKETFTL